MHIRISWLLVLTIIPVLNAHAQKCKNAPDEEHEPNQHAFIFLDRSASALADTTVTNAFRRQVRSEVQRVLRFRGNRVTLVPLYEKTLSQAEAVTLTNDAPGFAEPKKKIRCGPAVKRYWQWVNYTWRTRSAEADAWLEAMARPSEFGGWTDIWGTLGVLSERAHAADREYQVVFVTDMFESMPGEERRDFDQQAPSSWVEAKQWAREDVQQMKKLMPLDPQRLQNVSVRILRGYLATKPGAQYVKLYWQALFGEMGISAVTW